MCVGRNDLLLLQTYSIVTIHIRNRVRNYTTWKFLSDIYIGLVHVEYRVLHPFLLMIICPRMMGEAYSLVNLGISFGDL